MPPKRQLTDVSKPEVREPKRLRVISGSVPPPVTQSGDGTVPAPIIACPFSPLFCGIAADDGMEVVPPSPTSSDGSLFGGYDDDDNDSDGSLFGGGHDEDATASDDADAHDSSPSYPEIALPYGPRVIHPLPRIRGYEAATAAHMQPPTIARGVRQELSSNVGLLPSVTAQQQQESQGQAVTSVPMYAGAGLPAEQYINSQQMEQLNVHPSMQAGQNQHQAQVAFSLYNPQVGQQFNPQQQVGQFPPTQTQSWPLAQAAYPSYSPPVGQYTNPQQYVEQSAPFQNQPGSHSLFGGAGPQAGQFAVPPQQTDTLSHGFPQQPLPTPQPPYLIDAGVNDVANASGHVYHVPHPSPQDELANPPAAQIDVIALLAGLEESIRQYRESNQHEEAAAPSTQAQTIEQSPVEFHGAALPLDGQFSDPRQETYRRAHATSQQPTHALAGNNIMSQQPQNFGPDIGLNTHPSLVFLPRTFNGQNAAQNQSTGFPWMGHSQVQNVQNQQGMVPFQPALFQRDVGPAQYNPLAMYAAMHAGAVGPQQRFHFGLHAPPHVFAPQLPVLPTMDVQQQQLPLPTTNGTLSGKENPSRRRTGGSAQKRKSTTQSPDGRCKTRRDQEEAVLEQLNAHNNGQRLYDDGALMRARGYLPSLDLADVSTGRGTEGEASTSTSVVGADETSEANGTKTKKRGGQTRKGRKIPNDVVCPCCPHVESRPDSLSRHFKSSPECKQRANDEYNLKPNVVVPVRMASIFLPKYEANFVDFLSAIATGTPKRQHSVQSYVNYWWDVRAHVHERVLPI